MQKKSVTDKTKTQNSNTSEEVKFPSDLLLTDGTMMEISMDGRTSSVAQGLKNVTTRKTRNTEIG
jgi:hypothetical protein